MADSSAFIFAHSCGQKRRYWPLGTVSSLTQTTTLLGNAKEVRLHNRWMQLSMQAEALLLGSDDYSLSLYSTVILIGLVTSCILFIVILTVIAKY